MFYIKKKETLFYIKKKETKKKQKNSQNNTFLRGRLKYFKKKKLEHCIIFLEFLGSFFTSKLSLEVKKDPKNSKKKRIKNFSKPFRYKIIEMNLNLHKIHKKKLKVK